MELRIRLFRHLEKMAEVVGFPIPGVVSNGSVSGNHTFVISLDVSNFTFSRFYHPFNDQPLVIGEHDESMIIAENKAVMSVTRLFEESCCLQIHDISHSKVTILEQKMDHLVTRIKAISKCIESYMKEFEASTNLLEPFLTRASQNGTPILSGIGKNLEVLFNVARSSIDLIEQQLSVLGHEMPLNWSSGSSKMTLNSSKAIPLVWKIFQKDFLADILDALDLPPARYCVDNTVEDAVRSTCTFQIGGFCRPKSAEIINITGEPKQNASDAEESAAAHAIRSLELSQELDVVDFNYHQYMGVKQQHDSLMQLSGKYEVLSSVAVKAWSDLVASIQTFVNNQYDLSSVVFWDIEKESEYEDILSFASDLQEELYQIMNMQHSAASIMASPVQENTAYLNA